jgi:hypothetical protein
MSRWKVALLPVSAALVLGGIVWTRSAQSQEDRPRFDPAEFQKQRLERMKTTLGASDDDWKALSPKVEKVMAAQRETMRGGGGGGFFGGGRGGPGGPGGRGGAGASGAGGTGARPDGDSNSPISKAANELRTALDDKATSGEDVAKKLTAYREARSKARDELAKAQKDLRELLTQRQEASLVLAGMLD